METRRIASEGGMTLLETLLTMVFLMALTLGLLQLATSALLNYSRIERQWKATVACWNDSRAVRAGGGAQAWTDYIPFPGARPLRRYLVGSNGRVWEVLRAEK